jgi:hypothetical protein
VSITNNDSSDCAAGVFSINSSTPIGWATSIAPLSLSLAPGQSGSATVTKTVPAATQGGNYTVGATVVHGTFTANAVATCSVPSQPPVSGYTITGSLSAPSYRANSWAYFGAAVTGNGQPVAGLTVRFLVTQPNGSVSSGSATSDVNGLSYWTNKVKQRGTYSMAANVTIGGQTFTSTPLTFTVY